MGPTDYTFVWIDVTERLPDTYDPVLVWGLEYNFEGTFIGEIWEQARFDGEKRRWELDSYGTSLHNPSKVTHWMEITRKEDTGQTMTTHYHETQREQARRRYAVCAALLDLLGVEEPGSQAERQARGLLSTLEAELQTRPSEPTREQRRVGLQTMKRND